MNPQFEILKPKALQQLQKPKPNANITVNGKPPVSDKKKKEKGNQKVASSVAYVKKEDRQESQLISESDITDL